MCTLNDRTSIMNIESVPIVDSIKHWENDYMTPYILNFATTFGWTCIWAIIMYSSWLKWHHWS